MIIMNNRALQDVPMPFGKAFVENKLSQVHKINKLTSLPIFYAINYIYHISNDRYLVFQGQTKEEINEILEEFRTPTEWPWTGSDSSFALVG